MLGTAIEPSTHKASDRPITSPLVTECVGALPDTLALSSEPAAGMAILSIVCLQTSRRNTNKPIVVSNDNNNRLYVPALTSSGIITQY